MKHSNNKIETPKEGDEGSIDSPSRKGTVRQKDPRNYVAKGLNDRLDYSVFKAADEMP